MYGRRTGNNIRRDKGEKGQSRKRRRELAGYLKAGILGLCAGIIMVFASITMKVMAASETDLQGMDYALTAEKDGRNTAGNRETDRDVSGNEGTGRNVSGNETAGRTITGSDTERANEEVTNIQLSTSSNHAGLTAMDRREKDREPAIIIDPGHGGEDEGCAFEGTNEKDINRRIAGMVVLKLRSLGYPAELARSGDTYIDKAQRVEDANRKNALLYVSIHQNSCQDTGVSGIETWYDESDVSGNNRRLAQLIHQETIKSTGAQDRELMDSSELYVTARTNMPSCLIETGFLSNKKEREKLDTREYQEQIADGIVSGIDLYLNPKVLYLTFDDGPSADRTEAVLDILAKKNIKATFFVIGEYVRKNPEIAKRIVEEGHTIGIHCDVHDYRTIYRSVDSYIEDFEKAYNTVLEVTGVETKLFRFPGGSVNGYNKNVRQDIIEEMEKRGFIYYDWNASVEDAVSKPRTTEQLIQNAKDTALGRKKVVLLAHDRIEGTVQALEALIDAFPEYQMEPLTEKVEPVHF